MTTTLKQVIQDGLKVHDKFIDSEFYSWQTMNPNSKGSLGEAVVSFMLTKEGHVIGGRVSGSSSHDRTCNFKKIEIKTAFEGQEDRSFLFYGYSPHTDPHYWCLLFVSPNKLEVVKMNRQALSHMKLQKSRNNLMFSTTPEDCIAVGGKMLAEYHVGEDD